MLRLLYKLQLQRSCALLNLWGGVLTDKSHREISHPAFLPTETYEDFETRVIEVSIANLSRDFEELSLLHIDLAII